MGIRMRHFLSSKNIKLLEKEISGQYPFLGDEVNFKNVKIEYLETDNKIIIYSVNNEALWIKKNDIIFPSLVLLNKNFTFPSITIDMGAVPFISKGADVMRPGITDYPKNIVKKTIVKIIDEKFGKALAVGKTLLDYDEFNKEKRGKAVKIIHYITDEIWGLIQSLNLIPKKI